MLNDEQREERKRFVKRLDEIAKQDFHVLSYEKLFAGEWIKSKIAFNDLSVAQKMRGEMLLARKYRNIEILSKTTKEDPHPKAEPNETPTTVRAKEIEQYIRRYFKEPKKR